MGLESGTGDPVTDAQAFLIRHLAERRTSEQLRVAAALQNLVTVEALLSALGLVEGEEALHHRSACEAERARLIAELSGCLYAWQLAGGSIALVPPDFVRVGSNEGADPISISDPANRAPTLPVEAGHAITNLSLATDVAVLASADQLEQLRSSMGRWRQDSGGNISPWMAVDAAANALRLQRLLTGITLPPAEGPLTGSALDQAAATLDEATTRLEEDWGPLAAADQRLLLSLYTCVVRHLQGELAGDDPLRTRLNRVFYRLVDFSRAHQPGIVNGLQHAHQPRHGSWVDDARGWLSELQERAGVNPDRAGRPGHDQTSGPATVAIDQILREEGFITPHAQTRARALLEEHKLTQRNKPSMDARKAPRVRALFEKARLRVCRSEECTTLRRSVYGLTDEPVIVEEEHCDICGGSNNQRASLALVDCLRRHGIERLLVVGGGDDSRADLDQRLSEWEIEVREVDAAKGSHSQKDADQDLNWAQAMVIWGGTQLPHKVSNLYRNPPPHLSVANPNRRGVEALCRALIESLDGRPMVPVAAE